MKQQPDLAPPRGREQNVIKPVTDVPAVVDIAYTIPETTIVQHAPGWTVFKNLYMMNGTIFIVTSRPKSFPDIVMITSTGLPAENTPENIAARVPTSEDMAFLTPQEARDIWGGDVEKVRFCASLTPRGRKLSRLCSWSRTGFGRCLGTPSSSTNPRSS